jgi:hypothetical protein
MFEDTNIGNAIKESVENYEAKISAFQGKRQRLLDHQDKLIDIEKVLSKIVQDNKFGSGVEIGTLPSTIDLFDSDDAFYRKFDEEYDDENLILVFVCDYEEDMYGIEYLERLLMKEIRKVFPNNCGLKFHIYTD